MSEAAPQIQPGEAAPPPPAATVSDSAFLLVRRSGAYAIANFSIKAVGFLLLPLYTRFLTPADYGTISLAETVAVIAGIFCGLGLDGALRRLYFQYAHDPEALRRYVSSVLRFAGIVTLVVTAVALSAGPALFALFQPRFAVPFFPFIAVAVVTAALSQLIEYSLGLYQAQGRAGAYARFAVGYFLVTAACMITLVVVLRRGALGMLSGKLMGAVAGVVAATFLSRKWLRGGFQRSYVTETVHFALPLVPHQFMALGLIAADRFILERYRSLDEIGLYALAYTFGMVMSLVTVSLSQAWTPMFFDLARGGEEGRAVLSRVSSSLVTLLAGISLVVAVLSDNLVDWFLDPRYHAAGRVIPWIVGGYLFHAFFALFQLSALQGKKPKVIPVVSVVAFALNIGLNLWLVPRLGMYGAAYATLAAYIVEAALMYWYAQKIYPVRYRWLNLGAAMLAFGAALASTQIHWKPGLGLVADAVTLAVCGALLWAVDGASVKTAVQMLRRRSAALGA